METVMIVGVALLGMVMGSFAGAQVWRLRAHQLKEDLERETELRKKDVRTDDEEVEFTELEKENKASKSERKKLLPLITKKRS